MLLQRLKKQGDLSSREILTKMDKQIDRQIELVNGLLDVSRMQAGKLEYQMELINLDELIIETIDNMQSFTKSHKLFLKGNGKAVIFADRERIRQVLINLLTNAIKYSPNADRVIIHQTKNKHNVKVSIQDFGIGIAPQDRENIFEQFFQSSNASGQTYPGLGLGLYVSSEIVKQHKGEIWVESIVSRGSTFFLTLPIAKKQHLLSM